MPKYLQQKTHSQRNNLKFAIKSSYDMTKPGVKLESDEIEVDATTKAGLRTEAPSDDELMIAAQKNLSEH